MLTYRITWRYADAFDLFYEYVRAWTPVEALAAFGINEGSISETIVAVDAV